MLYSNAQPLASETEMIPPCHKETGNTERILKLTMIHAPRDFISFSEFFEFGENLHHLGKPPVILLVILFVLMTASITTVLSLRNILQVLIKYTGIFHFNRIHFLWFDYFCLTQISLECIKVSLEFFLKGDKLSLTSAIILINHLSVDWYPFKDPVSVVGVFGGCVVRYWSVRQVPGSSNNPFHCT